MEFGVPLQTGASSSFDICQISETVRLGVAAMKVPVFSWRETGAEGAGGELSPPDVRRSAVRKKRLRKTGMAVDIKAQNRDGGLRAMLRTLERFE